MNYITFKRNTLQYTATRKKASLDQILRAMVQGSIFQTDHGQDKRSMTNIEYESPLATVCTLVLLTKWRPLHLHQGMAA